MFKVRPYSNRYVYNSKEPIVKTAEVFASLNNKDAWGLNERSRFFYTKEPVAAADNRKVGISGDEANLAFNEVSVRSSADNYYRPENHSVWGGNPGTFPDRSSFPTLETLEEWFGVSLNVADQPDDETSSWGDKVRDSAGGPIKSDIASSYSSLEPPWKSFVDRWYNKDSEYYNWLEDGDVKAPIDLAEKWSSEEVQQKLHDYDSSYRSYQSWYNNTPSVKGKGSRDSVTILDQLVSDEGNEANDNFKLSSEKDMLIFKLGRIEKSLYKKGYLKRSKQLGLIIKSIK